MNRMDEDIATNNIPFSIINKISVLQNVLIRPGRIPERLVIEDILCTLRGDFQLITIYDSDNNKIHDLIVKRTNMIYSPNKIGNSEQINVIRSLLKCRIYLKELSLSKFCSSTIMPTIGDWCKDLTKLEFVYDKTQADLYRDVYIRAFGHLIKLLSIEIKVINGENNKCKTNLFPTEIINQLPEKLNEIRLFFEQSSKQTQQRPLFFNLEKFKHLHRLTMRYCNLDDMIEDISKKSTLDYLDIRGSWMKNKPWPVFNRLVHLKHIDLPAIAYNSDIRGDGAKSVSSAVVSSIFNTCKHLEYFDMSSELCSDQSEPNISIENWANLGNLDHFGIGWEISDTFATKMVEYCQKLKYLDCKNINHVIIKKLTQLQNLECLKLHDRIFYSVEAITAILNNCEKLKRLEIVRSNLYVNNAELGESRNPYIFNKLSKLQYLEYLDLSRLKIDTSTNSIQLQDVTIILIANNCKNLKYLNIGGCVSLTEDAFNALTKLTNLKELTVDHTAVTNNSIGKLEGLKFFSCVGCLKLTEAPENGINQLIKNCPDLEQLVLGSIDNNFNALKTIIAAADLATENRINGIILYIRLVHKILHDFRYIIYERDIKSQWLVFVDCQDVTY